MAMKTKKRHLRRPGKTVRGHRSRAPGPHGALGQVPWELCCFLSLVATSSMTSRSPCPFSPSAFTARGLWRYLRGIKILQHSFSLLTQQRTGLYCTLFKGSTVLRDAEKHYEWGAYSAKNTRFQEWWSDPMSSYLWQVAQLHATVWTADKTTPWYLLSDRSMVPLYQQADQ